MALIKPLIKPEHGPRILLTQAGFIGQSGKRIITIQKNYGVRTKGLIRCYQILIVMPFLKT